jgi:5-methylthioadenosine/S-adenosylhomocysteine deaminase
LAAIEALEMATLGGARFLGLEQQLGSLEPGKQADMIAVDLSDIRHQPVYHPTSQLTYTATGQDVTHTWIAGELLYANRQHNRSDLAALRASIQDWQSTINRLT